MIKSKLIIFVAVVFLMTNTLADRLSDIQKAGVLRAGVKVDFEPFGFKSRRNQVIGFDIDILKYIAKELKVKLKLIPVTSKNRVDAILSKKVDIVAASMTHKISSDRSIDFTITYFYNGQSILASSSSTATNYQDFESKKVAAQTGSSSGKIFEVIQPLAQVVYEKDFETMLEKLKSRKIDAITSDYGFLRNIVKKSNGTLKIIGKKFTVEPYGIGLPENESNLRDQLNFTIQKLVKDKEYTKIYKKWFKSAPTKKPVLWP